MSDDFSRLRLKYYGNADKMCSILQMECRHKCAKKLARTLSICDSFEFPSLALAEMSTSDDVADIHADMVGNTGRVLDMTAGLGIDTFRFAERGCDVTAIDLSAVATNTLRHNAAALGLADKVRIIEGDSVEWLRNNEEDFFDVIFIDPARRDDSGRHFALSKCSPDVTTVLTLLLKRCRRVIIKASPMVDISAAKRELGIDYCKTTVIGTNRECKEVVFELSLAGDHDDLECVTVDYGRYTPARPDSMTYLMPLPGDYLMQPYPAVMKGTGGIVAGYDKLHPATHLYVSKTVEKEFPGTHFKIVDILPFNKKVVKSFREKYPKINVITRNFPLSAPELVKKLKIQEGGEYILFGATLMDGSKVLIVTESACKSDK